MTTTTLAPLQDIISPKFHQNNFVEEAFVKNELGIKLDKGALPTVPVVAGLCSPIPPQTTKYAGCHSPRQVALWVPFTAL